MSGNSGRRWRRGLIAVVLLLGGGLLTLLLSLYFEPRVILQYFQARSDGGMLYFQTESTNQVALTIDDGPDGIATALILDELEEAGFKATFFLLSEYISDNEAVVQRILAEGHELGNHGTEDQFHRELACDEQQGQGPEGGKPFTQDVLEAQRAIAQAIGENPGTYMMRWFRPSQGIYGCGMLDQLADINPGYQAILGSIFPVDTSTFLRFGQPEFSANFIARRLQAGDVIVLHDRGQDGGNDRGLRTVEAIRLLKEALDNDPDKSFEFVTLSELFPDR